MNEVMVFLNDTWSFARILLPIIGTFFAIYFAVQKLTKKVVVSFTISMQPFSSQYISNIVVINKRDNTLSIWSVYATIHKDIKIKLDEFATPLILKPYETITISLPKFSTLTMGSDEYEPEYSFESTKIYLDIGSDLLLCESELKKDLLSSYRQAAIHTFKFGKHVYNQDVAYILSYFYQDKSYVAFIHKKGMIGNEWNFAPNSLGTGAVTEYDVKHMLLGNGFDKLFSNFLCYEVNFPKTKLLFRKLPNGDIS